MGALRVLSSLTLAAVHVFAMGIGDSSTFSTDPCLGPECFPVSGVTRHVGRASGRTSAYHTAYTDPMWPYQWYVHDYREAAAPVMDMNVVPVHRMGYTGRGVNVAVVDAGVELSHPDLQDSMLRRSNNGGRRAREHGTQAAGLIKMAPNNTHCGVGLAYGANIVDINTGGLTDTDNRLAQFLTYGLDSVDIYSNSWGPEDDGESMTYRRLALSAIKIGATKGRKGKGSIYVFAGGNGKESGDNCGADDLVNSVYTIGVAGATSAGKTTHYGERCSALLATAYSGGDGAAGDGLVTTMPGGGCTTCFEGTSASAPVAAAIVALTLQANPDITYRDVMHIITMGTEVAPLADNGNTWNQNGEGFWVSNDFGFGLLNAKNMVKLTVTWNNVPPLRDCTFVVNFERPKMLGVVNAITAELKNDACVNDPDHKIGALEQFQLSVKGKYSYRGALEVFVTTAKGTKVTLMETRANDKKTNGFGSKWVFKSVHGWGEDPCGKWVIGVKVAFCDEFSPCRNVNKKYGLSSFLNQLNEMSSNCVRGDHNINNIWTGYTLKLFGTQGRPPHASAWPRTYSAFRLPNKRTSRTTSSEK